MALRAVDLTFAHPGRPPLFAGVHLRVEPGEIVGLTGPTANLSLFFLRDLLASSLILWMLRPCIPNRTVLSKPWPKTLAARCRSF